MRRYIYVLIIYACFFASSQAEGYVVDSVFVTNILYLQRIVTMRNCAHGTLQNKINTLNGNVLIIDQEMQIFLKIVERLSGIKYWYNCWVGYGVSQEYIDKVLNWYLKSSPMITEDVYKEARSNVLGDEIIQESQ